MEVRETKEQRAGEVKGTKKENGNSWVDPINEKGFRPTYNPAIQLDTTTHAHEARYIGCCIHDEQCAPKRRLQEGHGTEASSPPDRRIWVSPGAHRGQGLPATTPSRRRRRRMRRHHRPDHGQIGFSPRQESLSPIRSRPVRRTIAVPPPSHAVSRPPCHPHGHGHRRAPKPRAPPTSPMASTSRAAALRSPLHCR